MRKSNGPRVESVSQASILHSTTDGSKAPWSRASVLQVKYMPPYRLASQSRLVLRPATIRRAGAVTTRPRACNA